MSYKNVGVTCRYNSQGRHHKLKHATYSFGKSESSSPFSGQFNLIRLTTNEQWNFFTPTMIARISLSIWEYLRSAAASVREWSAIGASLPHGSLWARTHSTPCGEASQFLLVPWPWGLVDGFHLLFRRMDSFSVDSISEELYTIAHKDAFFTVQADSRVSQTVEHSS
ncbi:hypothetical protein T09_1473 [Trichinella sp. T9]|nr:hypothetical protein T09_1473 [Trichinella sp. T9]